MVCALAARVNAHETDQFTVPVGKRFADLGDLLTEKAYETIEAAVEKTNANIRRAKEARRSAAYIRHKQSPAKVTGAVFGEFLPAYFLIEGLENMVHSRAIMRKYPGRIVGYRETEASSCCSNATMTSTGRRTVPVSTTRSPSCRRS